MLLLSVLLLGFFAFEAVGYLIHRVLHANWAGNFNRAHMIHHRVIYPVYDFLSDHRYVPASAVGMGVKSDVWRFALPAVVLAAATLWLAPLFVALPLLCELAVVGAINALMHDAIHVRGHWLERFQLFRNWRAHHVLHHVDMGKNFGIVTFISDRIARTYWRPQP